MSNGVVAAAAAAAAASQAVDLTAGPSAPSPMLPTSGSASSLPPEVPKGKDTRKQPVQYSHFYPPPPISTKYVTSSYIKTDQQTLAAREAANGARANGPARKRKAGSAEESDGDDDDAESDRSLAARTIIIHPGSTQIRVGLATDVAPVVWPNVLARRNQATNSQSRLPTKTSSPGGKANGTSEEVQAIDEDAMDASVDGDDKKSDPLDGRIALLRTDLRSIMRNMKLRGVSNGKALAASFNAQAQPEKVPSHNDFGDEWTPEKPSSSRDIELGARALRIPSLSPPAGKEAEGQAKQNGRPWRLYRPFRAGRLNHALYLDEFGSAAERVLLSDAQAVMEGIISAPREDLSAPGKSVEGAGQPLYGLGIPRRQYASHSVILIVPDLCPKYDLRALTHLLLVDMGFSQIIVQQESTAATYGAGMSSACVVHAGGQRMSISCVDEGLLLQETRMHLDYGGEDITQFLYQLLMKANFGYRNCSPVSRVADAFVLDELKRQMITLDASQIGLFIYNFYLRLPDTATRKWEVRVYDEAILAPMALFGVGVRVLELAKKDEERRREIEWSQKDEDDIEDGIERKHAITLAMSNSVRHLIPQVMPTPVPEPASGTNGSDSVADISGGADQSGGGSNLSSSLTSLSATSSEGQHKASTSLRSTPVPPATSAAAASAPPAPPISYFDIRKASAQLPLDVALFQSLLASTAAGGTTATGEERMKRLASNILIVGGSARIPGIDGVLEARLIPHLEAYAAAKNEAFAAAAAVAAAASTALGGNTVASTAGTTLSTSSSPISPSVIPPPRDLDPTLLAWKGMAVLPRLESANDMWVSRHEWDTLGWKAMRDKSSYL